MTGRMYNLQILDMVNRNIQMGVISPDSRLYTASCYRKNLWYKTTVAPFRNVEEYECPECHSIVFLWFGCKTQCWHGHTLRLFGNALYVWGDTDAVPIKGDPVIRIMGVV